MHHIAKQRAYVTYIILKHKSISSSLSFARKIVVYCRAADPETEIRFPEEDQMIVFNKYGQKCVQRERKAYKRFVIRRGCPYDVNVKDGQRRDIFELDSSFCRGL
jgi:hypothetical protein